MPETPPALTDHGEEIWVSVIHKMEEVYSDLIQYEVELEEKNAALEEAQRFITSVLSSVSDILVVCDTAGRIQQVNLAFLTLTAWAESDLIGRPLADLLAVGAEPVSWGHWLDGHRGGNRCVRFHAASGAITEPVELSCATRHDHRGLPAGIVLTGRRIGELRQAYDSLKQAQARLVQQEKMASLGRLIAGVAHELNNPISFVVGNVHTLAKYRDRMATYLAAVHSGSDEATRDELRHALKIDAALADLPALIDGTMEGAQRVADLVKSLKRLSFTETAPPEPIDLVQVVRKAEQWAASGRHPALRMVTHVPASLPVRGQAGPLQQVVLNVLENALDAVAGQPTPEIMVCGRIDGDRVVVTIADNGPGIPPEHLDRVFDPFFTTKPVGQGTGLGLWISYGIIRDHDGSLDAANRPEGGAVLSITLPLSAE